MTVETISQRWAVNPYQQTVAVRNALATVIQLIIELVCNCFNVFSEQELRTPLSYEEILNYARGFNRSPALSHVVQANNYQLESIQRHGWSAFNPNDLEHSLAYKVLSEVITSNNLLWVPNGKRFLVIPVNILESHWTSIHVNLNDHTIYYLDPLGNTEPYFNHINYHWLIDHYLQGMKSCLEFISPGNTYRIVRGAESPSVIQNKQQFDGWNCGIFLFHYALKAAELSQRHFRLGFCETQASVWSLRRHAVQVLRD